jgi:hypothetical protein
LGKKEITLLFSLWVRKITLLFLTLGKKEIYFYCSQFAYQTKIPSHFSLWVRKKKFTFFTLGKKITFTFLALGKKSTLLFSLWVRKLLLLFSLWVRKVLYFSPLGYFSPISAFVSGFEKKVTRRNPRCASDIASASVFW